MPAIEPRSFGGLCRQPRTCHGPPLPGPVRDLERAPAHNAEAASSDTCYAAPMPTPGTPPKGGFVDTRLRRNGRWLLMGIFSMIGVLHFVRPDVFVRIMPAYLPWHQALVLVSGFFEIAGGVGLVIPKVRTLAAWGLLALLVAVFPANINMAVNADQFADVGPAWVFWARLPLQPLLMYVVWRCALTRQ